MWNEQFEGLLRAHLSFLPDDEELSPELDLREFGLDSLGVVDLLVSLESAFSVRLADDFLSMDTFATPGALWAALNGSGRATIFTGGLLPIGTTDEQEP